MQIDKLTRQLSILLNKLFDQLLEITGLISGILYTLIMFALGWEVFARKVLNRPTTWAIDFSTLGIYFASLIAIGWVLKHEGHVSIELLTSKLNTRKQFLLSSITSLVGLAACLVTAWQGVDAFSTAYKGDTVLARALDVPKVFYLWAFPFGFFVVSIQFVRRISKFRRRN